MLLGCEMTLPKTGDGPAPEGVIAGAPIAVKALDSAAKPIAATATKPEITLPVPKPGLVDAADPEMQAKIADAKAEAAKPTPKPEPEAPPPPPQTPEEIACAKTGGVLSAAGDSGAKACVKRTRDSGKSCTRENQCEGLCLARSGTCAPIAPMFGCNDIFQDDGRQVTLCIE